MFCFLFTLKYYVHRGNKSSTLFFDGYYLEFFNYLHFRCYIIKRDNLDKIKKNF